MHRHPEKEFPYLEKFSEVDINQVGGFIGCGSGHNVYAYESDRVIKVPRMRPLYPGATADDQDRDLDLCREHFPRWILPSSVQRSFDGRNYCILQKRVDCRNLTNAEPDEIDNEFLSILDENRKLVRDAGVSLDFLGMDGLISCYWALAGRNYDVEMSNVVVDRQAERVVLPDSTLLRLDYDGNFVRKKMLRMTFKANCALIKRFWGEDIA